LRKNGIYGLFRRVQAVESGGERNEIRMAELRLLDSRRESDDREARIQQDFCDVSSEASVSVMEAGLLL